MMTSFCQVFTGVYGCCSFKLIHTSIERTFIKIPVANKYLNVFSQNWVLVGENVDKAEARPYSAHTHRPIPVIKWEARRSDYKRKKPIPWYLIVQGAYGIDWELSLLQYLVNKKRFWQSINDRIITLYSPTYPLPLFFHCHLFFPFRENWVQKPKIFIDAAFKLSRK